VGNHGQRAEEETADEKRRQAKNGADAQANFNVGTSGLLDLHQAFINARRVNQQVKDLRACPKAKQDEQSIGYVAGYRGGVPMFPAEPGPGESKISHKDLREMLLPWPFASGCREVCQFNVFVNIRILINRLWESSWYEELWRASQIHCAAP
jgi:hypothetical protein